MSAPSEYLYVIGREEGPVKVGISRSPYTRVATLQTGCPFKIGIIHLFRMNDRSHAAHEEANFHTIYADKRLAGEWFDIDADLARECIETSFEIQAHFASREAEA